MAASGCAPSSLVAVGEEAPESRPLRLVGTGLYLDRYWREECQVAADLRAFGGAEAQSTSARSRRASRGCSARPMPSDAQRQQRAASRGAAALRGRRRRPGHGQDDDGRADRRAARRAGRRPDARRWSRSPRRPARPPRASRRPSTPRPPARRRRRRFATRCSRCDASTLHRLLGWRPDSHSRFRHHRGNRLPHDVVIVDETSMVSLSLMARLVEAVRPEARLVLVGDPGQLTSIEAGAVLGDIVAAGGDGVVVLERVLPLRRGHRRSSRDAIRAGDGDAVIAALTAGHDDVDVDPGRRRRPGGAGRARAGPRAAPWPRRSAVIEAARAGRRARARSRRSATFRVLCAHRRGVVRRERLDGADRGLAGRRARARPLVPGPAAARDRERLRAAALQRRHGRRRRTAGRGTSAPRSSAAATSSCSRRRGSARSTRSTR